MTTEMETDYSALSLVKLLSERKIGWEMLGTHLCVEKHDIMAIEHGKDEIEFDEVQKILYWWRKIKGVNAYYNLIQTLKNNGDNEMDYIHRLIDPEKEKKMHPNKSLNFDYAGPFELVVGSAGTGKSMVGIGVVYKLLADSAIKHALPEDSIIVSSIRFCNGGDNEIQHCVDLTTERQCKSMKFIEARWHQIYKKIEVSVSEKGHFSMHSQYGKLHVTEPVIAAILYMPEKKPNILNGIKISQVPEMLYREHLVYQNIGKNTWILNYIITPNLYSIEKAIDHVAKGDVYSKKFHFANDRVVLDIPTINSQEGWSVIPLSEKNYIMQQEVDKFFMWSDVPAIKVLLRHEGGGNEDLHIEIKVSGAEEEVEFFIQRFYD